ncbi:conserved oligomeric Golgi complex subunit 6-like [Daphnia pulicaria]|uniref:conserved oligomeric Golgi complex subunit 6-like n=1 Tax=Daphnia pulicaria TaxID=35523 RepID=UPI001EEAC64A|nr:conserved oligomeric Golgi complex subunit 6-like [Daphnia pulicaria]
MESSVEKANPLAKKLAKIQDNQFENDKDTLEALKELSTFFSENSIRTRRNLRGEIEGRSLAINQDIFKAFHQVKEALNDVHSQVLFMDQSCKGMSTKLAAVKTRTHQLMSQMTSFQTASNQLSMEQMVASKMIETFQLTPAEVTELQSFDRSVNPEFFTALRKSKHIHQQCKQLLQSGHQTTAFEIMEQMASYQETALERLYRWTQNQCRNVDSPDSNILLTQAISCLQDRPILLKYVVDEYCTVRRGLVARSFLDALTVGGPYGTPRPIELHAHDPARYVGDMLAWLHQMTPTEKENAQALLKGCDKSDIGELVKGALSNITEGVCRPLRLRLEQVISPDIGPAVLHTLSGLIRFYLNTIGEVVPNSALIETLNDIFDQCHHTFLTSLESHVHRLLERIQPPSQDLSPSLGVNQLLNLLRDVLSGGHIVDAQASDVAEVVSRVLDPLMQFIENTAGRLPRADQAAYTLNCVYQIHSSLSLYEHVEERLENLQGLMENQLTLLSTEQATSLIHSLGLGPVCALLQNQNDGELLSNIPGMDSSSLQSFLIKLDALLGAPDALQLAQWKLLISGSHRKIIQRRALDTVLSIYEQLYDAVHNPANCYENPSSIMPRTPQQVRNLLA